MGNFWQKKPKEKNLQQSPMIQMIQILPLNDKISITTLFFPCEISEQRIIETIKRAKREMRICVYFITDTNIIAQVLSQIQSNKDLLVRIITHDVYDMFDCQIELLEKIFNNGHQQVQIKFNSAYGDMHNKYLVVDDEIVITGSFNWTQKALYHNNENIVIIEDKKTASQFIQNFEDLWADFTPFRLGMKSKKVKLVRKVTIEKSVQVQGPCCKCKMELSIKKSIIKRTAVKKIKNNKNGMLSSEYLPQKSEYLEESDQYE